MFGTRRGSRTSFGLSKARQVVFVFEHAWRAFFVSKISSGKPQLLVNNKIVLSTSFSKATIFAVVALLAPFGVLSSVLFGSADPAEAAINEQLHFQARLLTSAGDLVPDGNYNVQFHIYSGGDGDPGTADETLQYSGSFLVGDSTGGIAVANGYVSAQLGDSNSTQVNTLADVPWDNGTLWLSINIGNTSSVTPANCDTETEFNTNCGGDGEMGPFIRLGSTPYAFNSKEVGGRGVDELVQLNPGGTSQAVNTANAVIDIDQAGAGALVNLEVSSTPVFTIANNGNVVTSGDIAINGGDLTSTQTTFNLLNGTVTTLNIGGAATTVELGAATGTTSINNALTVDGNTTLGTDENDTITLWGQSGTTAGDIVFGHSSFQNCTALETDASGILTCGVDDGASTTLQSAYNNDDDDGVADIVLTSTDGELAIRDAASTIGDLFVVENNDGSTDYFNVSSSYVTSGLQILAPGGSAGAAGYTFSGSVGTGLYLNGGILGLSYNSTELQLASNGNFTVTAGGITASESANGTAQFLTLQNTYNAAASTDETVVINLNLASGQNGAQILAGKESDFTSAANRDGYLALSTISNGTLGEKLRITSVGTVGIGETTPGAKLEVDTDDGDNVIGLIIDQDDTTNNNAALVIQNAGSGDSLNVNSGAFTITGAGDVGIGATATGTLLNVIESGAQTADTYAQQIQNTATNVTTDAIDKYGLYITSTGSFTGSGGTATNNYALYLDAVTGADNNYGLYIEDAGSASIYLASTDADAASGIIFAGDTNLYRGAANQLTTDDNFLIRGGSLLTDQSTFNLLNTTATTLNIGGAATTIELGAATGTTSINNSLTVDGNTTIGNANTDTLTINAGSSGTGISFGDSSFANCSALETVSGILTCGTDDGGAAVWTTDSNVVNLVTDSDTVTIGSSVAGGKLFIDGDADEVQLQVQAAASQTAGSIVFLVEQNDNDRLFEVTEAGNATILNRLTLGEGTSSGINAGADLLINRGNFSAPSLDDDPTVIIAEANTSGGAVYLDLFGGNLGVSAINFGDTDDEDAGYLLYNHNGNSFTLGVNTSDALSINSSLNATFTGDVAVNGGDLTTNQTTFNLVNTTATTLNIGGAATAIELGAATGTTSVNNALTVDGLITGQLGLTASGAAINLNVNSNFNTNINTGTSSGAVTIGSANAGAIAIQSGTSVGITGTTTITGATTGNALTISNSTSTGNILVLQDNATQVLAVGDGGDFLFNIENSNVDALQIRDQSSNIYFNVDTTNNRVSIGDSTFGGTNTVLNLNTGSGNADPAGADEGTIYYNPQLGKFRCNEGGAVRNCISDAGVFEAERVQDAYDDGTTASATFGKTPEEGNLLVAISTHRAEGTTPTISGTGWTLARNDCYATVGGGCGTANSSIRRTMAIWYKIAGASEPTNIQTSWDSSPNNYLTIQEFKANGGTFSFDNTAGANSATSTTTSQTTGTSSATSAYNTLSLSVITFRGNASVSSWTNGYDSTLEVSNPDGASGMDTAIAFKNVAGTGTQESTGTINSASYTLAAVLNFSITPNQLIVQDGNSFGSTLTIGTNDNNNVNIETNGSTVLSLDTSGNATLTGDLQVQGGDITTNQTTFNLINTTATTLNIGGAATTLEVGAATGTTSINNSLTVDGNTTIGDANTDTLTINAGSSGSGITFADSSFQSCTLTTSAGGVLTCVSGTPLVSSLTDNVADAFDLQEGSNNYININTTDSSENISFGNATTNPSYNFLGSGTLSVAGATDITGDLTVATDAFYVDSTNSYVGINNSSPNANLDIIGTANTVLTGSIDPTASALVFGAGTAFTTELEIGDAILVSGEIRTVIGISSDTLLVVNNAFSDNALDTSPEKLANGLRVASNDESQFIKYNGRQLYVNGGSDTSTTADTKIAQTIAINDSGAVASGTDQTIGLRVSSSNSGATGGTINTYGIYANASGDTGGDSTAVAVQGVLGSGADSNFALHGEGRIYGSGTYAVSVGVQGTGGGFGSSFTGSLSTSSGGRFLVSSGNGTITSGYGVRIQSAAVGTGSITSNYGLYVEDQTAGGTDYGIYVADAENYSLYLASTDGDAASGITFGGDTNLYRSAANVLQTDDNLLVGSKVQIGDDITNDYTECATVVGDVSCNASLEVVSASTESTTPSYGTRSYLTVTPGAENTALNSASNNTLVLLSANNFSNTLYGNSAGSFSAINASTGTVSVLQGVSSEVSTQTTGTISNAYGGRFNVQGSDSAAGTITNAYGIRSQIAAGTQTTITDAYGVYISTPTGSNIVDVTGLYVNDQTGASADNIGINIVGADDIALWLGSGADNTDAANGITFGSSRNVNLYRGGDDLLVTDDAFTVTGDLTVGTDSSLILAGGTALPGSPVDGEIFWDDDDKQLLIYDGGSSTWEQLNNTSEATFVVAASNSDNPYQANYRADGTADEVQINAAIDAATAVGGGTVYLMEGTYSVAATIDIDSNVELIGSGKGTIIELTTGTNPGSPISLISEDDNPTNWALRYLVLDGNDAGNTGVIRGIGISNVNGGSGTTATIAAEVEGVTIREMSQHGILATTVNNISVRDSIFIETGANADSPAISFNSTSNRIQIENNQFYNPNGEAIEFSSGVYDSTVRGNVIHTAVQEAISIEGDNNVIIGNTIRDSNVGIEIIGNYNSVSSNSIRNSTTDAFVLNGADVSTFTANVIDDTGNTDYAFELTETDNSSFIGNTIYASGAAAFYVNNTSADNIISGNNIFEQSGVDEFFDILGDDNQIISNHVEDTAGDTVGITIDAGADGTYIADNVFDKAAGTDENIVDNGTNTVIANQTDTSGNLQLQATGDVNILSGDIGLGQASTTDGRILFYDGSGSNTVTLTTEDLTADIVYRFADAAGGAGTYDICTTDGNCDGSGGLQGAYDNGPTILTADAVGDLAITVAEATNFSVNVTGTGAFYVQDSGTDVLRIADGTGRIDVTGNVQFAAGAARTITVATQTAANTAGDALNITGATGNGSGAGGAVNITGGTSGATGVGGAVTITGGAAATSGYSGGGITISGANSTGAGFNGGGSVTLQAGDRTTQQIGAELVLYSGSFIGNGGVALTAGGGGVAANVGGSVSILGGAGGTTGNNNGGNISLAGGAGNGSGVQGIVIIDNPSYTTATDSTCGTNCTVTQSAVDSNAAVIIEATAPGLTITIPNPTITTAGRLVYITAADGSEDFDMLLNNGDSAETTIAMRENTTATLIWNGSDWTAAGASSSTTLQSAYASTLTSAGGAEIVLNAAGGSSDGLTVRNNDTTPIIGAIFEAQTSIGSNLFSVNNNATEYANNGGAESAFASDWSATPDGGTVTRYTTLGNYIATGVGSVQTVTTGSGSANQGAENTLTTALTANLRYSVSFAVRGTSSFNTLDVYYSPDGLTTSEVACTTGETVTQGVWSRVICTFDAPASGITSSNSIFIRQSDSNTNAYTYYVENLSVTVKADVNHVEDGDVDDSGSFATNWNDEGAATSSYESSIIYNTSGSVQVDTTAAAGDGVSNNLAISPDPNTQYLVTFYARSSNTFDDIRVRYTRDGGSNYVNCTDYNTRSVSTSGWTLITCLIATDGTTPTNSDLVIDQETATARTFYIDAIEMTLNENTASNVQIGGGNLGGPTTLLTLDRSAGPPVGANNDAYLGSMYYDTTTGRIQCYEAGGWGTCGAPPDNIVNLNPEYAGSVLNGSGIGTMQADACANETGVLEINTTLCGSGEARSYYSWTSPQGTEQIYSIYITYQLPSTFDGFDSDDTVQLTGRVDNTTNAEVSYEMFHSDSSSGSVDACGSETVVTTSANTWQTVGINGNEATGCGINSSDANDFIIFKINLKANSNANAYTSTLSFTTTGR